MLNFSFKSLNWWWTCNWMCSRVDHLVCFWIVKLTSSSLEFELLLRNLITFLLILDI